ncbi:MAG: hypothetical protein ACLP50_15985 [Solirubrobacteraceae bacterium]
MCARVLGVTVCTVTYRYASSSIVPDGRVQATTDVRGRIEVVAHGTIRRHELRLTLAHLRPGRYRLTLLELRRHATPVVIGHTTVGVS